MDRKLLIAWAFLIAATIAEVVGTSFLKLDIGKVLVYGGMAVFIALAYFLMAFAIIKIPVGTAYAVWELIGTICIALISVFYFGESLSFTQTLGIILAVLGIVLINIGEKRA